MRLLFITYDFPYPANSGGKVRAYNLLKFGAKDIEVFLFSFVRRGFDRKQEEKLRGLGVKNIWTFERKKLKKITNLFSLADFKNSIFKRLYFDKRVLSEIKKIVYREKIDVIHFESFFTAFYIEELIKEEKRPILIFGTENIEYKIYKDYSEHIAVKILRPLYGFEAKKIGREELDLLKKSDLCLAVTKEEADYVSRISGKKTYIIENGVDTDFFKFSPQLDSKINKNLLFVGNFSYFPNVQAVNSFYENTFLKIKDKNIFFLVVGKNSTKLYFSGEKNVKCIDYVEDIRKVYYNSDIFIFPLKTGGGTNFKILEAAACGIPIVAFADRVKSLGLIDKRDLLIAADYQEFYQKIKLLLSDKKLVQNLTKNARELIEKKFSWQVIGGKVNKIWKGENL